jgi:glycyl-tRNA synthetase
MLRAHRIWKSTTLIRFTVKRYQSTSENATDSPSFSDFVSFCKRRGFAFQSSQYYGGLTGMFDYGPLGAQLKKNIRDLWWRDFIELRRDCVGLDTPIILHPQVWKSSGHIANFTDPLIECTTCHQRFRADHLIKDQLHTEEEIRDLSDVNEIIKKNPPVCPCSQKKSTWTEAKTFNLLFKTKFGAIDDAETNEVYLRPETAQGIFINFQNVVTTTRKKLPIGIGQTGKAFRNEISPRDFLFRTREFEQMELEYFCHPNESRMYFQYWVEFCVNWLEKYGLKNHNLRLNESDINDENTRKNLAHYASQGTDIEYKFPFGWSELWGIANRGDFDLQAHSSNSPKKKKEPFHYIDPVTHEQYVPHCVEPSVGIDRLFLAFLYDAYHIERVEDSNEEDNTRVVLKLHQDLAPFKFAVFPLQKKPVELLHKAEEIFEQLSQNVATDFDASGSMGRLYRRHDEIGTPYCITIDHQTLQDNTITIRYRDSMQQIRVNVNDFLNNVSKFLKNGKL